MPFSYSQLKAYRVCPRQFEYAFVKKLKGPLTPEGSFGVSMHTTLAKWGKLERAMSGELRAVRVQVPLFSEADPRTLSSKLTAPSLLALWHSSFVIAGYKTKAAADFDRARGAELLRQFYTWWAGEPRKVVAVEKGFRLELPKGGDPTSPSSFAEWAGLRGARNGVLRQAQDDKCRMTVTGRFDRVEQLSDGTLRIIDFKSGGRRSQEAVDLDLQLSIYALAARETFQKEVAELVMLFLPSTSSGQENEEVSEVKTMRSSSELATAATTIQLLAERIASKDYHPTPSREVCKNCPYRRICDVAAV